MTLPADLELHMQAAIPTNEGPDYNVYRRACPTRQVLDRIANKWAALVVGRLEQRSQLFRELRGEIEGIPHSVLTRTLRGLETDGLVTRRLRPTTTVSVEYSLTSLGRSLSGPLAAIRDWAEEHIDAVLDSRAARKHP